MAQPTRQDIFNELQRALMSFDNMPDGDEKKEQGVYVQGLREAYLAIPEEPLQSPYKARSPEELATYTTEGLKSALDTYKKGGFGVGKEYLEGEFNAGTPFGRQATAALFAGTEGVIPAAGEAAGTLLSAGAQALAPERVEAFAVDVFKDLSSFLLENPWAEKVLNLAKENYEGYLNWKDASKENELKGRQIESFIDVAALGAPPTKLSPILGDLPEKGKRLKQEGQKGIAKDRRPGVQEMLEPLKPHKAQGEVRVEGYFDDQVYVPTRFENEVIDVVADINGINPNRSAGYNIPIVNKEIVTVAKELEKRINKAGNPEFDKDAIIFELNLEIEKLLDSKSQLDEAIDFRLAGGSSSFAKDFTNLALKIINDSDGTALGLLQARREIDRRANDYRPHVNDPAYNSVRASESRITRLIRNKLNEELEAIVPEANADQLLRKQFLLFDAKNTLNSKFAAEVPGIIERIKANIKRATGITVPMTPLGLAFTGSAILGFISGYAPYVAGGAAIVGTGAAIKGGLSLPKLKKAIGTTILGLDSALKKTENSAMIKELKADRVFLVTLLNDLNALPEDAEKAHEEEESK